MIEIPVRLTRRQAHLIVVEFERIAKESDDANYRREADNILKRFDDANMGVSKKECPNCGRDITTNLFEQDPSQVDGFIDIGYDCEDCKISVFTFKVEKLAEDEDD